MSFDIHAIPARFKEGYVESTSRISGKPVRGRSNHPMTADELAAVRAELEAAGSTLEDARAAVVGLDDRGFLLTMRGELTPKLVWLVFRTATLGNLFLVAAMPHGLIAISTEQARGLPPDLMDEPPTVCETADALAAHLGVGMEAWEEYRRHVVRQ